MQESLKKSLCGVLHLVLLPGLISIITTHSFKDYMLYIHSNYAVAGCNLQLYLHDKFLVIYDGIITSSDKREVSFHVC